MILGGMIMNESQAELVNRILEWPVSDRGELVAKLLNSLEPVEEDDASAAWADEVRRRASEIDNGQVTLLTWEEVRQSLRGQHGRMVD